ncbi:MAG: hypothetical protein FWF78_03835, partial [Defluviitaleaceae bacterium]|nr:hypothetical protein [Defluviitaleaceae bacterium]
MNPLYLKTLDYTIKTSTETMQQPTPSSVSSTSPTPAPPLPPQSDDEIISETLKENGFKATEKNKKMAKQMRDNGIPLTKENLQKMNQAVKLTPSADKALFMLQNNAKLTQENANIVENLSKISIKTEKLEAAIEELKDAELAEQCKKTIAEPKSPTLKMNLQGFHETLDKLRHLIQQPTKTDLEITNVLKEVNALELQVKIASQIKNQLEIQPEKPQQQDIPDTTPIKTTTQIKIQTQPQPTGKMTLTDNIPTNIPTMPTAVMSETLLTLGFKNTEENQTMLKLMFENGIPLIKDNILKFNQAMKLTQSSNKALFMLQNDIKLTQANAQQLERLISGQAKITDQLHNLLSSVGQLDDKTLSSQLKQILTGDASQQIQTPPLPANLQFPLANSTPRSIENYLQSLREALVQIQQHIQQASTPSPSTARVLQEANTLESHIDFTSQIRNQIYVQLPIVYNGEQTLTNLHIYKDAKKSASGGKKKESSSALIALETANLGHFETYVQKTATAVTCQFRLDNDEITAAVRNNIHKLEALLR